MGTQMSAGRKKRETMAKRICYIRKLAKLNNDLQQVGKSQKRRIQKAESHTTDGHYEKESLKKTVRAV